MVGKETYKPNYFGTVYEAPECTKDFNTAQMKLVKKINDQRDISSRDKKIIKLMVTKKKIKKTDNLKCFSKDHIEKKLNNYNDIRMKNIESIQDKVNDNFYELHTFHPKTNAAKGDLRDLNHFLVSQTNHLLRINDKVNTIKQNEEKKLIFSHNPKVDEKSCKIFNEKYKSSEGKNYVTRLYKVGKSHEIKEKNSQSENNKELKISKFMMKILISYI